MKTNVDLTSDIKTPFIDAYNHLWMWRNGEWVDWIDTFVNNNTGGSNYLDNLMGCSSYDYDCEVHSIKPMSSGNYKIDAVIRGTILSGIEICAIVTPDGNTLKMSKKL